MNFKIVYEYFQNGGTGLGEVAIRTDLCVTVHFCLSHGLVGK